MQLSKWWRDRSFDNTAVPFTTFLPEESLLWESKIKETVPNQKYSQSVSTKE